MLRHLLAGAVALACLSAPAYAQTYYGPTGTIEQGSVPMWCAGTTCTPVSASNPLPVSGSFSASLSGFTPGSAYSTPLSVSTTSSRVALPVGTTVVVYNPGSNPAYTQLGGVGVTATTSNDVIPAGGWMAFTVGSNTYLAAITASGSTALNISGGSGLPTGSGGGSSGGGSVPTGSAGSPNAAVLSVQGISGGFALPVSGTFWQATQPVSAASLPLPTGAAQESGNLATLAGAISGGVSQSNVKQVNGVTTLSGAGATGTGSLRVTAAQDATTIAGSAPGTAGSPSANVVTVQGASSGTPLPVSGTVTGTSSGAITNPTSTLSLTATTSAYAAQQLVANSATAGSVSVPSFSIANAAGGAFQTGLRLSINDTTASSWNGVSVQVDEWSAAPTFANGDRGTFLPTGVANHIRSWTCTFSAIYGDGAWAECSLAAGNLSAPKLASGTSIYWTVETLGATGTTGASKTITATAELSN